MVEFSRVQPTQEWRQPLYPLKYPKTVEKQKGYANIQQGTLWEGKWQGGGIFILHSSTVTGGIINILFAEVFQNIEKQMESFYFKSGFGWMFKQWFLFSSQ